MLTHDSWVQVRDGKLLLSIPCEVWEGGFRIALVEGKFWVGNFSPEIQAACLSDTEWQAKNQCPTNRLQVKEFISAVKLTWKVRYPAQGGEAFLDIKFKREQGSAALRSYLSILVWRL